MYNQKTAWENQKEFLKQQMSCGFPNIEKAAKQNYERMLSMEKNLQTKKKAPAANTPASTAFTPVSKTVITTYQNSKGVKRTVRETTVAPGAKTKTAKKCVPAKNGKGASKK